MSLALTGANVQASISDAHTTAVSHLRPARTAAAPESLREAAALDAAPLAPLHPAAREVLLDAIDNGWADPARLHGAGRQARRLLDEARESVADVFGARPDEIFFTASGPGAAQEAVLGAALSRHRIGAGVVISAVEHAALLHAADWLGDARTVAVSTTGSVTVETFLAACRAPGVAVAVLQSANGEVGSIQPLDDVRAECLALGVPLVVDVSASLGHLGLPAPGLDHVVADARAWGGPPGVGVRVTRTGARWRRPGPAAAVAEPVPLIVAAAAALTAVEDERAGLAAEHHALTARLREVLPQLVPDLLVAGPEDPGQRLPHLLTVSVLYVDGEALVTGLDRLGVATASGSACTAETVEPSHVLAAMGFLTQGNLRISLGRSATEADIEALISALPPVVARIRDEAGVTGL